MNIKNIYELYLERVFSYVGYRVGNVRDTEDIVAEIFLSISRSELRDLSNGKTSLDAWVFTIARNKVIDFHRKNQKTPISLTLEDIPEISSPQMLPEETLLRKERFIILRSLINGLPRRQQEIINLRLFGQLKNKEIASLLGVKERTVSAYLARAIKQLERAFAEVHKKE